MYEKSEGGGECAGIRSEKDNWDEHWNKTNKSVFGKILSAFRKHVLAYTVRYYHDKYFSKTRNITGNGMRNIADLNKDRQNREKIYCD